MNAKVLDTLMQLFARIAGQDELTDEELRVIRTFLYQQLSDAAAQKYLKLFREYVLIPPRASVTDLCGSVNAELTSRQKIYILVRLLELINADHFISAAEVEAFEDVVKAFNISPDAYEPIFNFITTDKPRQLSNNNLLIISSSHGALRGAHMQVNNLPGYMAVLHIEGEDIYIMRYIGGGDMLLNGQTVLPSIVYILSPGSVIRSNRTSPIFYSDLVKYFWTDKHTNKLTFSAQSISYKFKSGGTGLHSLSIHESSGQMVAIMGGSGAGKSTLLNVLNGTLKPNSGTVTINGFDIHTQQEVLEGVIGYVSQDDLLIEELTVYDNLYFNGQLCFKDATHDILHRKIETLLRDLGLWEIRDLPVGNPLNKMISGGQRKRLNIAMELLRQPAVLFVDEPTSGLSSTDSQNVMDLLKELSLEGKLIFVVIHQPSSDIYKMFDRLILLDNGGYPIFYGDPLEAVRYFRRAMNYAQSEDAECGTCGNVTAEQMFALVETRLVDEFGRVTTIRKMTPAAWYEIFQSQPQPTPPEPQTDEPERTLHKPGIWPQMRIFFKRDLKAKLANPAYWVINSLEPILLGLLLAGLLYYIKPDAEAYSIENNENIPAYLFTTTLVALFIGLTLSAEEILKDRRIRQRERFLHLSYGAYLFSKMGLLMALSAAQMAIFVLIANAITGIQGLFWPYWGMLFSLAVFANVLGLNISSAFDRAVTVYILVPLLLIPQILLSGALVSFSKINPALASVESVPWAGNIMASRWAYEALAVVQFRNNRYERLFYPLDKEITEARYRLHEWLPRMEASLDVIANRQNRPADAELVRQHWLLIRRELERLPRAAAVQMEDTNLPLSAEKISEVRRRLGGLRGRYSKRLREKQTERDQRLALVQKKRNINELRQRHHNRRLAELVTGRAEDEAVLQIDDRLVRVHDPVFREPKWPDPLGLKAHFYAPIKRVGGARIDTYFYNLITIWLMTALLFAALYFRLLRRLVEYLPNWWARIRTLTLSRSS